MGDYAAAIADFSKAIELNPIEVHDSFSSFTPHYHYETYSKAILEITKLSKGIR
jgi:hypothetical protein